MLQSRRRIHGRTRPGAEDHEPLVTREPSIHGPKNPPQGSGLVVQGNLTQADGLAERKAALEMFHRHSPGSTQRLTLGADKGYDAFGFVSGLRQACVTPHFAKESRYSAIDGRTIRHEGNASSPGHGKKIDLRWSNDPMDRFLILLTFGWAKSVGGMAQTMYRGVARVRSHFILTMAANNRARLPRLLGHDG